MQINFYHFDLRNPISELLQLLWRFITFEITTLDPEGASYFVHSKPIFTSIYDNFHQ